MSQVDGRTPEDFLQGITDEVVTQNIQSLFSPELDVDNILDRETLYTAFINLTCIFLAKSCKPLFGHVQFDLVGIQMMLRRFQRDSFGVSRFHAVIDGLSAE